MNNKINIYLERFWLVATGLVFLFFVYELIVDGANEAKYYLIFLILPICMWMFRRFMRIKMEKNEAKKIADSKKNKRK